MMPHTGALCRRPEPAREGVVDEGVHIAGNAGDDTPHPVMKRLPLAEAFAAGQPAVVRAPADPAAQAYVNLAMRLAARFGR